LKTSVVVAMTTLVLSLGACAWSAMSRADSVVKPADMPQLRGALERAAQAAQGQRVLVVTNKPGAPPSGRMFESSRSPTGWVAHAPTPTADDPLLPALTKLAEVAAGDFAAFGKLAPPTVRALGVFDVRILVVGDVDPTTPELDPRDPSLGAAGEVPGILVRHAQPVRLFLADEPSLDPGDAIGFARALRFGDAVFQDFEDHAPWGMDVTIDTDADAEYLLPTTAAGARVTIDGASATFRAARVPMLVVKVPAGRHKIVVRYADEGLARQWITVVAAAGAVASLIVLWLALRPEPATEAAT